MDTIENTNPLEAIDARTKLAGSNKLEILLFSLGTQEIFGINVFKVREVTKTPSVTPTPNMPAGIQGVISLRGHIIPVISLASFFKLTDRHDASESTMLVTEYSRRTQGFLVHDVDRIVRVDWDQVKSADGILSGHQHMVTAITELPSGKLVSIVDVEQILVDAFGEATIPKLAPVEHSQERTVFFVDDSAVARREIAAVLDQLGVKYHQANNGKEAWERLQSMAQRATQDNQPLLSQLNVILVDAEMPEMDGYVLTQNVKSDRRFEGIPVVMHSSLSSDANRSMGKKVGVDAYVAKFDASMLGETLRPLLQLH
jgi:two-component system, chemotaxis family, chemotaxis protein CheV